MLPHAMDLWFQTLNSVTSNNISSKYQRFTPAGCKDMGTILIQFVAKTQFISIKRSTIKHSEIRTSVCIIGDLEHNFKFEDHAPNQSYS